MFGHWVPNGRGSFGSWGPAAGSDWQWGKGLIALSGSGPIFPLLGPLWCNQRPHRHSLSCPWCQDFPTTRDSFLKLRAPVSPSRCKPCLIRVWGQQMRPRTWAGNPSVVRHDISPFGTTEPNDGACQTIPCIGVHLQPEFRYRNEACTSLRQGHSTQRCAHQHVFFDWCFLMCVLQNTQLGCDHNEHPASFYFSVFKVLLNSYV